MKNIEIKASVNNVKQLLQIAKKLAGSETAILKQHDTFYNTPNGRLKLRRFVDLGTGELIFYERPDTEGPKLCSYDKVEVGTNILGGLNDILIKALGAKTNVKKVRHLFLVGQTRIHIDEVENLGNFMELEVCLTPEQSLDEGEQIAHNMMAKLGIEEKDLISGSYADFIPKL